VPANTKEAAILSAQKTNMGKGVKSTGDLLFCQKKGSGQREKRAVAFAARWQELDQSGDGRDGRMTGRQAVIGMWTSGNCLRGSLVGEVGGKEVRMGIGRVDPMRPRFDYF
jgi:hypothetical protein